MTRINGGRFAQSVQGYVAHEVAQAKGDPKKLPKDLQDNYAHFKAAKGLAHDDLAAFQKSFAAYAARTAEKAGNDPAKLPEDLQDNAKNFTAATTAHVDSKWLTGMKDDLPQKYFDGELEGSTTRDTLPPALQREWDRLFEDVGFGEYEPEAFKTTFNGKPIYAIAVNNDGGMTLNVYDEKGKDIANGYCGESTEYRWNT